MVVVGEKALPDVDTTEETLKNMMGKQATPER